MTTGMRGGSDLPEFLREEADFDQVSAPAVVRRRDTATGMIPGEAGVWIFILGDMAIFGAIMLVLLAEHRRNPQAVVAAANQLLPNLGAVNTVVLLASSYLVVRASYAHRGGRHRDVTHNLAGALGCAALFVVLKVTEYVHEFGVGNTPTTGIFFTYYFALTGLHLAHVLIGVVLLGAWSAMALRGREWQESQVVAESIAVYWHMVDLLWIAIFTVVYLVCAQ